MRERGSQVCNKVLVASDKAIMKRNSYNVVN